MKIEILNKIEKTALDLTIPYCMNCHVVAPSGVCKHCKNDDLARWLDGVGVDWSPSFAIQNFLKEKLNPVDLDEAFEVKVRCSYPKKCTVGWMRFDTVDLLKSEEPISWWVARDEYISELESNEEIISFDGGHSYYWVSDLEFLVDTIPKTNQ